MKCCFYSLYAYPLANRGFDGAFGGSEVRAWTFAHGLARSGRHQISLAVFDHGQAACECSNGVSVYANPGYIGPGKPGRDERRRNTWSRIKNRLFGQELPEVIGDIGGYAVLHHRLALFDDIAPDLICVMGVNNLAAEVVFWARTKSTKVVIMAGSDSDFAEGFTLPEQGHNQYGVVYAAGKYAIDNSDGFIVQTERQRQLLRAHFNRDGWVIRNPIDLVSRVRKPDGSLVPYVVWVGKFDPTKQPDVLARIAKALPTIQFRAVINASWPAIEEDVVAGCPANLEIIKYLDFESCEELIAGSALLLNTSRFEGFPNTFLQAGKYAVPVASLSVDPDEYIEKTGSGIAAGGDEAALSEGVHQIMSNSIVRESMGASHMDYVERMHEERNQIAALEAYLETFTSETKQNEKS